MYASYFGFQTLPFSRVPGPGTAFESAAFVGALRALRGCVDRGVDFALLMGDPGVGKTTMLSSLAAALESDGVTILAHDADSGPEALVNAAVASVASVAANADEGPQQQARQPGDVSDAVAERRLVVFIDDAHLLPNRALLHLPALVRAGEARGARVTVILAAQPELEPRLRDPELAAFMDTVTVVRTLGLSDADELDGYVRHKLDIAGYRGPELFDAGAIRCLSRHCGGNAKRVDTLSGIALLIAFDTERRTVNERIVDEAALDHPGFSRAPALAGASAAAAETAANGHRRFETVMAWGRACATLRAHLRSSLPVVIGGAHGLLRRSAALGRSAQDRLARRARRSRPYACNHVGAGANSTARAAHLGVGDETERDWLGLKLACAGMLVLAVIGLGVSVLLTNAGTGPDDAARADRPAQLAAEEPAHPDPNAALVQAHRAQLEGLNKEMRRLRESNEQALEDLGEHDALVEQQGNEILGLRSDLLAANAKLNAPLVSVVLPKGVLLTFSSPDGEKLEIGSEQYTENRMKALIVQGRFPREVVDYLRILSTAGARASAPEADVERSTESISEPPRPDANEASSDPREETSPASVRLAVAGDPETLRLDPHKTGSRDEPEELVSVSVTGLTSEAEQPAGSAGVGGAPIAAADDAQTNALLLGPDTMRVTDTEWDGPSASVTTVALTTTSKPTAPATLANLAAFAAPQDEGLPRERSQPGAVLTAKAAPRPPVNAPAAAPEREPALKSGGEPPSSSTAHRSAGSGRTPAARLASTRQLPRPAAPNSDDADYVVVAGDTLTSIAARFDVTVAQLREWNGLTSDALRVGQPVELNSPTSIAIEANRELLAAVADRQIGPIAQLLDAGASPDARDSTGKTALMHAASRGDVTVVRMLAEWGANVDLRSTSSGGTALLDAAWGGHTSAIAELLRWGANVDATNADGWTALMYASINGHERCVETLLTAGATVNSRNGESRTALSAAVWNGHVGIAKALLDKGAKVNERLGDGWTALMEAAWNGQAEMVDLLLSYRADPNAASENGLTPAAVAKQQGHSEIAIAISRHVSSS